MNYIKITDVENAISFQFNNAVEDGCVLSDIAGFEDGLSINSIDDIASRIGAVAVNTKTGRRKISFVARLTCDVLENRRNMMAALRRTGFLKLMQFQTVDATPLTLRCMVYFDKITANYKSAVNKPMLLQFTAPDPRFYSDTETTITVASNDSEVVVNSGNEQSNPLFRLHGPFTSATVTNLNNNQSIVITETIVAGEYIDIDTQNQTVKLDDGTSVYSSITGTPDFIVLEPGNNTIQFDDAGGAGTTELDVIYRNAYNGL